MALNLNSAFNILMPYLRRNKWQMIWVFFLVIFVVSIDMLQPIIVQNAIDNYISVPNPNARSIALISLVYFFVVLLGFGLTYYQSILLQATGQTIIKEIRVDLFKHIQSLS